MSEDNQATLQEVQAAIDTIVETYNHVCSKFKGWHKALAIYFPDIERSCTLKIHGSDGIEVVESMDETAAVRMTVSSTFFVKYMARQMTAIAMYSSGELQVKGAMSDLVKLRKLGL